MGKISNLCNNELYVAHYFWTSCNRIYYYNSIDPILFGDGIIISGSDPWFLYGVLYL